MKKIYYLLAMLAGATIGTQSASAQKDSSGIYKTAEDFQQRKLTYAINCKTEKHKINPNVLFKASVLNVKHMGATYTMKKSEVFAYRACDGKEYRFVDNIEYSVLNPSEPLILYVYQHLAHSPKSASQYPPTYYFSKGATTGVQELTKANLKSAFPDNHGFHDALDENFKEEKELINYDSFHKMYKVNWLFKNHVK